MYKFKIIVYRGGDMVSVRIEADDTQAAQRFAERLAETIDRFASYTVERYE